MNDKIKMFIADEEVVSNNDFTINEEMLSASSTILNNCYPKSWELTKDYVSNFYYPKDYSRFVLAQGEYEHGNQEFQPLEITGKNLFSSEMELGTLSGSGEPVSASNAIRTKTFIPVEPNTTYSLSNDKNYYIYVYEYDTNYTFVRFTGSQTSAYEGSRTLTTISTTKYIKVRTVGGRNENDLTSLWQLEKGNVATTYEPYNQPNLSYETNVEKEINTFNIYGRTYQETRSGKNLFDRTNYITNGAIVVDYDNGVRIINTTSSYTNKFAGFYIGGNELLNKTINIHLTMAKSADNICAYRLFMGNSSNSSISQVIGIGNDGNGTFNESITLPSSFANNCTGFYLILFSNRNGNSNNDLYANFTNIQVELGSSYTGFEPYGASPSPDYPSDLVSVGYQNLLENTATTQTINGITFTKNDDGTIIANGTATANTPLQIKLNFELKDGEKYRLSCTPGGGSISTYYTYINQWYSGDSHYSYDIGNGVEFIYNIASKSSNRVQIQIANGTILNNAIFKPIITKGTQAHSYIPYGKYGVEIVNIGKNLFNLTGITDPSNVASLSNGIITLTWSVAFDLDLKNAISNLDTTKTYTVSFKHKGTSLKVRNTSVSQENIIITGTDNDYTLYNISINNISGFQFRFVRNETTGTAYLKDFQLEEGNQATTYEEYKNNTQLYVLDEPLRQVGTYKDKLYTDGRVLYVKREIGKVVLNGSENWSKSVNGGLTRYASQEIIDVAYSTSRAIISSNYFYYLSSGNEVGAGFIYAQQFFAYPNQNITTVDAFKTWLSTHNTEVNYILATPTITPLGYIDLPISYEGINNTTIYTDLDTRTELWYYWKNYDVLFAGVVKNSGDISLNPRHPHYCSLQILDYKTFLSESNTLDFVIANKTVSEAIEMVVNAVKGYGFVVGNIDIDSANDNIGAYSTLNKTAYDVLQYLAEISGSRWRARVIDSLTMAIDFYDPDNLPQADDIEYTKEYWEANNIVDMTFNYGSRDYRNKQILLSNEVYGNINYEETLISNGYGNTFTVQNNIGILLNVIVDGAEKTIATINDKQMGIDADFYYTPGKNIIESNGVYSAGTMIRATYQPLVKGRQIVYNASEVERISNQTQTEGVIARYESRNDILSSEELQKIAQTYIDYKGKAEVIIKITTQDNDLYDIGEVVYFNAPIDDLKQNYMVKAKDIEYIIIDKIIHLFYVYELTSSFNSEKAINYFDNQRNKASGNIQEGDSITRNIDIETQVGIIWIGGAVSSTTITVDGDNVLNSILNSPFVE